MILEKKRTANNCIVCNNPIKQNPSHKRGGVGIKAAVVTAKTGPIITVQTLEPGADEALLISQNGQTIRVALKDIPTLGRTTQGVRVMRLGDSDAVSSIGIMQETKEDDVLEEEGGGKEA